MPQTTSDTTHRFLDDKKTSYKSKVVYGLLGVSVAAELTAIGYIAFKGLTMLSGSALVTFFIAIHCFGTASIYEHQKSSENIAQP